MRKLSMLVAGCVFAFSAAAAERSPGFEECRTLEECLAAMDADAHSRSHGAGSKQDDVYRARLETFGERAKRALLARAAGDDRGWSNLAGAVLMEWQPLGPDDVPALVAALRAEPNGWVARPLARIATPEAVEALSADVRAHGAQGQSGIFLAKLGDRALPLVLSLLADPKKTSDASFLLGEMKEGAIHGLDPWLVIARDDKQPKEMRLAALRGIGLLGSSAKRAAPQIRPLLQEDDRDIVETAIKVLEAMADQSVVADAITSCDAPGEPGHTFIDREICLSQAAAYGEAARPFGNWILLTFAQSPDGSDRASAATTLGFIGYREAESRLVEMLRDPDWHVVYAALRALGWLGATDALAGIDRVATDHWLSDVRDQARIVAAALRSPARMLEQPKIWPGGLGRPPSVNDFIVDATMAPDVAPCTGDTWRWNGRTFHVPRLAHRTLDLPSRGARPAGTLSGTDRGEWSGELSWTPKGGAPSYLASGNIQGIEPAADGALVVVGGGGGLYKSYNPDIPSAPVTPEGDPVETVTVSNGPDGSGIVLLALPDPSGAWRLSRIAVLPRGADAFAAIGDGLYAAWSGNRAVVLTREGIAGVAACVAK